MTQTRDPASRVPPSHGRHGPSDSRIQLDNTHRRWFNRNLGLWRSRGDHHAFVGEFAYQLRFPGPNDISHKALQACERFFLELQQVAGDWLALTTTKTGAVYRLKGNPPQAHE